MSSVENRGFDSKVVEEYRSKMRLLGRPFWLDPEDENSDEYVHFYFIGSHDGKEVVYDAVMYTLRLQHESEMFEIAEHRAAKHFPNYKKITYEEDENGNLSALDDEAEEIGLFMAEVIMELEEEESVKVKEHVDVDLNADFGVVLDIGLHVEKLTDDVIEQFISDFNSNKLELDTTLFTFQTKSEEA